MLSYLFPRQHALMWAALILLVDDVTKELVLYFAAQAALPWWWVEGQVGLTLGWNRGMSFSLLHDFAYAPWLLGAIAVAASGWFTHWLAERPWPSLHQAGLACVIGGALGNLVDRVQHGAVVDFIVLNPYGLFPYAFNVADAAISVGVALLLLDLWRRRG